MNDFKKGKLFFLILFLITFTAMLLVYLTSRKESDKALQRMQHLLGDIEFKGKVIKTKLYDYGGKDYYLICINLDSCNVVNVNIFNDICALKISNKIATMSAGVFNPGVGPVEYVEANVHRNNKLIFHYKNNYTDTATMVISKSGLTKSDLEMCK